MTFDNSRGIAVGATAAGGVPGACIVWQPPANDNAASMQINVQAGKRLWIRSMVLQLGCAEVIVDGPEVVLFPAVVERPSIAIGVKTVIAKQVQNGPPRLTPFGLNRLVHLYRSFLCIGSTLTTDTNRTGHRTANLSAAVGLYRLFRL